MKRNKLLFAAPLILGQALLFAGCSDDGDNAENNGDDDFHYEAIFLDNDTISGFFKEARQGAEKPYQNETKDFHITTAYNLPRRSEFYGKKVTVNITKYKKDEHIVTTDGSITKNEGFKVILSSDDSELQNYLDSLNKNFHITGSYEDAAVHTGQIDFSDGEDFVRTTEGKFGSWNADGTIVFE